MIGIDVRSSGRIWRLNANSSLAFRPHEVAANGDSGLRVDIDFAARATHGIESQSDLCIRTVELRTCLHETTDLVSGVRQRSFGAQCVIHHGAQQAKAAEPVYQAPSRDAVLHGEVSMFAKICADQWRINHHRDSQALQVRSRTDPG